VFAGENYYPNGGWGDFGGFYDTLEEIPVPDSDWTDWAHVVDSTTGTQVRWLRKTKLKTFPPQWKKEWV
jgi:hypothetical protein